MVEYFNPSGFCLDPCRGAGAFYDALPEPKDWCEIEQGRDFLTYKPAQKIDWIITNPPWSAGEYRPIARRCFELADNVVFLVRLHNGLGTTARHNDYREFGHRIKEIILCPWEGVGFAPEGFSLAVIHWQKGWQGDCTWTYWDALTEQQQEAPHTELLVEVPMRPTVSAIRPSARAEVSTTALDGQPLPTSCKLMPAIAPSRWKHRSRGGRRVSHSQPHQAHLPVYPVFLSPSSTG
jgi:hypothetical protein